MKVALLNDLPVAGTLSSGLGSGAELTSGRFIREGIQRGHQVDLLTPEYVTDLAVKEYDLIVSKNTTAFHDDQLGMIMQSGVPHVAWPSDFSWTKWRLYFAFQPWMKRLPKLAILREWFGSSKLNVFLSPLHQETYYWVMPELEALVPSHISPPPVDVDLFKPSPEGYEPKTACTVNGGLPFKSLYGCLDWAYAHPDVQFIFIGAIRENVNLPPNARHTGMLPQSKVAEILSKTETYVELPRTIQPFNQSAMQGFLACKQVVTNENLGAASFEWFKKQDREAGRAAMKATLPNLWTKLEEVIQAK